MKKYGPNKEYYSKSQIEVNHGSSKTFYFKTESASTDEHESRKQHREMLRKKMISTILDSDASMFLKDFPFLIEHSDEKGFTWNAEALEQEDDVNLTFKSTICRKRMENI